MFTRPMCLLAVLSIFTTILQAQTPPQCGTVGEAVNQIRERLLRNKAVLAQHPLQTRSIQYIPIKFQMVTQDDGSGTINYRYILDQLCSLNEDFASVGMQFYIKGDFSMVESSDIDEDHYHHSNHMMLYRDPGAINVWIVNTPFSPTPDAITYGLYQVSYDWLVIKKDQINGYSYTLSHEMGHFFSLLHTFYGWDTDPWQADKHGNPAPVMSPMNIPTELQNGSNCDSAGDYVCDTPPDYNFGYFWQKDCDYAGGAEDPTGTLVNPDESNFMTYFEHCNRNDYHFSEEQKQLMRTDLMSDSRDYIRSGYVPLYNHIDSAVQLESPIPGSTNPYNAVNFKWTTVSGATHYLVEIDRIPSFSLHPINFITADSSLIVDSLDANKTYYWRVKPFNEFYTCASNSPYKMFKTSNIATATSNIGLLYDWNVIPNPVLRNTGIKIAFNTAESFDAEIRLYNITGQCVQNIGKKHFNAGANTLSMNTLDLNAGIYLLTLQTERGKLTEKIVIQ